MQRPAGIQPKIAARWTGSFEAETMKQRPNKLKTGRKPERKDPLGKTGRVEPAAPLSVGRKWLFRFIAMAVLPLMLLGGLEVGLRLAGFGYSTCFFEKIRIGEKDFWINNDGFSLRFFPPQLARWSDPVMLEAKKPANTYRIFILGESAARGEPEPSCAASRYLQTLLNERFPNTHFEVVNLGFTAINSHVILPIARDCAKADGDLWIIYMGNNEMVGPFGAATVFGAKAPPLGFVRLNLAIQKTRIGQLLMDISRKLKGNSAIASWGGMNMFVGNQLRADDPRKEVVYQNFERNLNDIVRVGLGSGAKILLNTVAVNLKDCPPFASLINSNLPAADRAQFDKLFFAACADEAQTNFAGAAQKFALAAKLDPQFPELQFRWGKCSLALNIFAAAREHFQTACDVDALPFRADSRINGVIQKIGRQGAGGKLTFFDAAAALAAEVPNGVCGRETFYEHVHFNFDGNFRLGCAWAEQVEKMLPAEISRAAGTNGWASQETCDCLLGLTDWNRYAVTMGVIDRLRHPPLSDQLNSAERMQLLRDEAKDLQQRMNPATAQKAAKVYLTAINRAPQDHLLHKNFAVFFEVVHDKKQAVAQWRQEQQLMPYNWHSFLQAGRLLAELRQWDEAEAALTKALMLRPSLAEGWSYLGEVHLATEKFESALQDYNRARQLEPQDAACCVNAGVALSKLNRHAEAIQACHTAIQLEPDSWQAHFTLGHELVAVNQIAEAERELAEVIRLQPGNPHAHLDLGVLLAKQGRLDEAQREFEEAIRLEPELKTAQQYLAHVKMLKNKKP
jgi:tetratricopeptide (TPR) repeat protein